MKKIKRGMCLILVIFVGLVSFLTGCAEKKEQRPRETSTELEPVKLLWYHPGIEQEDLKIVQDEFNKKLKEKINATVEFDVIDWGVYDDRMNMMIASQEVFDICFTSNWRNKYHPNVTKAALIPLDELIDKYAPNTKKNIPDFVFESARVNGKIYAIPNYQIIYNQFGLYIPKDLVEKYDFDVNTVPTEKGIETLRAIEPFLESIKHNEPNLYPYRLVTSGATSIYEVIAGGVVGIRKDDKSLKVINIAESEEDHAELLFFRDWYKKGYIRKDIGIVGDDRADRENQKYVVDTAVLKPGGVADLTARTGRDYVTIPLYKANIPVIGGQTTMNAISSTSKNPERAMMLLELMNNDKELYNMMCFGLEGVHYNKISDNQIEVNKDSKYNPGTAWMFGNQFNAYYIQGQQPGTWEETHEINITAERSPILGFNFNPEPLKTQLAQVDAVNREFGILRYGVEDPDVHRPEYLDKLRKAGIQTIIDEVQRQLNEWVQIKNSMQ